MHCCEILLWFCILALTLVLTTIALSVLLYSKLIGVCSWLCHYRKHSQELMVLLVKLSLLLSRWLSENIHFNCLSSLSGLSLIFIIIFILSNNYLPLKLINCSSQSTNIKVLGLNFIRQLTFWRLNI